MLNELVRRGNIVVLTFNQLVDSRAFFSLLNDPVYFQCFTRLFEEGKIRISQYREIRTISQYLLNSIDPQKEFIYSALPIKSSQRRLTALMRRSLIYSDLSEINFYLRDSCPEEELRDLFTEAVITSSKSVVTRKSDLSTEEMKGILEHLTTFLSLILRLSTVHASYIPPRKPEEYRHLRLSDLLYIVTQLKRIDTPLWRDSVSVISSLSAFQNNPGSNNRSEYLNQLRKYAETHSEKYSACQYAEAIISLCFNYACEISICNTSKRYDVQELQNNPENPVSFEQDFYLRLEEYWDQGRNGDKRFLCEETNEFKKFTGPEIVQDFSDAVRISGYQKEEPFLQNTEVSPYDYHAEFQEKAQKRSILSSIGKKLLFSLMCFAIAIAVQLLFSGIQDSFDSLHPEFSVPIAILEMIFFLIVSELVSSEIARKWKGFLSLSEAMSGITYLITDAFHILRWKAGKTQNNNIHGESISTPSEIRFITPSELTRYRSFLIDHSELIRGSDTCRIADTANTETVFSLICQEELTNQKFGLVYRSEYNTLLADPIFRDEKDFAPYER